MERYELRVVRIDRDDEQPKNVFVGPHWRRKPKPLPQAYRQLVLEFAEHLSPSTVLEVASSS